jgi:Tol biopolymer transport system component
MKYRLFIILLLAFSLFRCGQNITDSTNPNDINESLGKITLNLDIADAPDDVSYLKGILSRVKYDSIKFDFDIQDELAHAYIESISQGVWHLEVYAYNSDDIIIYFGSKDVNIVAGRITVVDLYLLPATGDLEIRVRWGIDNSIIYYDEESNIYLQTDNSDQSSVILNGFYPFWMNSKSQIAYHSPDNYHLHIADASTYQIVKTYNISGFGTFYFGRFSIQLNLFLFTVDHHGQPAVGLMDQYGNIEIVTREYPIANPVASGIDNWIYYLNKKDGTYDIYRMKSDQSFDESITNSKDAKYSYCSVSYDGKYIVTPKHEGEFHYLAVIETQTKNERTIDLTDLEVIGYPSFSRDNEYIYFTGGRNIDIHRIKFDGSDLKNLTKNNDRLRRALSW